MVGVDLFDDFQQLGFDLFRDSERLGPRLLQADFFSKDFIYTLTSKIGAY